MSTTTAVSTRTTSRPTRGVCCSKTVPVSDRALVTPCSSTLYVHVPQPEILTCLNVVYRQLSFFQTRRCLYIFAGQRSKEILTDFIVYDVDSKQIHQLSDTNCQAIGEDISLHEGGGLLQMLFSCLVPSPSFTQRATIDHITGEIHVLSVKISEIKLY